MFFRIVNGRMGYRVLPVGVATVGSLPDSTAFNSDGSKLLVANEAEPSDDYSFDPEGSLSVIDVDYDPTTKDYSFTKTSITFSGLTETDLPEGVRISGPEGTTVAQDLEPEYVSIIGNTAYVSLQENNAIAIVDLTDNRYKIVSAGSVDFSSLPVDFDDEDGGFKPVFASVTGLNMPDGLVAFSSAERTYFNLSSG
jgi:DNA-binding beta-propeller fold protein YncE